MLGNKEILTQFAEMVLPELQVAAGSHFGKSIEYEATNDQLLITASPFISVLVDGRKPTSGSPKSGMPTMRESILSWIQAKGIQARPDKNGNIPSQQSLAFMISRSIHLYGTKLYQQGGGNNIFDRVLTSNRIENLLTLFPENYVNEIQSTLLRELKTAE
jgi:hypothetical protein